MFFIIYCMKSITKSLHFFLSKDIHFAAFLRRQLAADGRVDPNQAFLHRFLQRRAAVGMAHPHHPVGQAGAVLIHYRAHFVKRLREHAPAIHADFSGAREELSLEYETVSTVAEPLAHPKDILPQLLEHQERHRQAELDSRQCLSGPHKDDFAVAINGQSAKLYGSQGQTRTAALSLKLAQREIFQEETGEWPVLLLDDVLSELDHRRQAFVLNRIRGGQVFITCCEEEKLDGLEGGRAFHVKQGMLI